MRTFKKFHLVRSLHQATLLFLAVIRFQFVFLRKTQKKSTRPLFRKDAHPGTTCTLARSRTCHRHFFSSCSAFPGQLDTRSTNKNLKPETLVYGKKNTEGWAFFHLCAPLTPTKERKERALLSEDKPPSERKFL